MLGSTKHCVLRLRLPVRLFDTTKFLAGVRKIVVRSNPVAVPNLPTKRIAEDLVVNLWAQKPTELLLVVKLVLVVRSKGLYCTQLQQR